jgi:hypothetical protein
LLPDAILSIMRIYQLDKEEAVGGVCSREATNASEGLMKEAKTTYAMKALDVFKLRVSRFRYKAEAILFPDPLRLHGQSQLITRKSPAWLESENAILVEHMTGFRMSFRTKLIKKIGFDEVLGRYALSEDIDASFSVLQSHLLVGARNAGIFHYKDPTPRGRGDVLGVTHVLNDAYVVCKHAHRDSPARSRLKAFFRYKIALYALAINSRFGRERFLGALRAYRCLDALMRASPQDLSKAYLKSRAKCLARS